LKNAMETAPDADVTEDMVMMIYETAALIGGYTFEDPGAFARRVTKLMEATSSGDSGGAVDAVVVEDEAVDVDAEDAVEEMRMFGSPSPSSDVW